MMKTENQNRARLERIANYGGWICLIGMVLIVGWFIFLAGNPGEAVAALQRGIPGPTTLPSDNILIFAGLVALLPALIFVFALWQARKLFGLIGTGYFLSEASQRLMVQLGRLAIVLAIAGIVSHSLIALLMTSANPTGQTLLMIEFDSSQFSSVIIAVLFFTFSLLMKETAAIAEENKSFI
jgi:cytochrome bd-type quinol oxidase subunit 2